MTTFPVLYSLSDIRPEDFKAAETYIMGLLAERYPDRDFGYGKALYWQCVVPAAAAIAANNLNADIMGSSLSLKWLRDNAATADPGLVEGILSNYYQALAAGAVSSGSIAVVVTAKTQYSVSAGTVFRANGVAYETTSAVFVQLTAAEIADTEDRLLTERSDGKYQFLVPVASQVAGVATFAPQGTIFTVDIPPPSFDSAVAATDISGGKDAQTVADFAATIPQAFAAQTFCSRIHVASMLAAAFPGTKVASRGFGDPEQWRDTHNPLQVQTGGMVDLYVATQPSVATVTSKITATLVNVLEKRWSYTIPRADAAGIYSVTGVVPTGSTAASMPIVSQARSVVLPTTGYIPLITDAAEAAFSAYQAITVEFTDNQGSHAGLSPGATRDYDITWTAMPLVQEISDYLVAGRLTGVDNVLVRGAVACTTRIAMVVHLLDSDSLTDAEIAAMKEAIVNRVAGIGFGYGVLSSSIIVDAVHNFLTGRSDVGANTVTLRGDIVAPTGDTLILEGIEIKIPNDPARMVTKNNTIFLTDVSRIDIVVTPVETP